MPKPRMRTEPLKASALAAMLADVRAPKRNETVKDSTVMAVVSELWGPCDWEGRNCLDVREALGLLDKPNQDSTAVAAAVRLTEYHLNGLNWQWGLRSCTLEEAPYKYFATLNKAGIVITSHHAMRASYALMMALVEAVEAERSLQLEARREKQG